MAIEYVVMAGLTVPFLLGGAYAVWLRNSSGRLRERVESRQLRERILRPSDSE